MSLYKTVNADFDTVFAPYHAGWPQAPACGYREAGADLNTKYAALVSGAAPANVNYRDNAAHDLSAYFAAINSTSVQVATQPSAVSGSAAAGNPSGVVTSGTTTVAGEKGGGTYAYTCVIATGSATPTAPNSATSGVTNGAVPAGTTLNGTMYWTISDGVTTINTNAVAWSLTNTTIQPIQHLYTGAGSSVETVPAGANQVVVEIISPGGGGEGGYYNPTSKDRYGGSGGESGTYCRSVYAVAAGDTFNFTLGLPGLGGAGGDYGAPTAGGLSTVSSGSVVITTMSAPGGNTGEAPSGGNQANVTYNPGTPGSLNVAGPGGAAQAGSYISGYGAGGEGGLGTTNGQDGAGGAISFYYTG